MAILESKNLLQNTSSDKSKDHIQIIEQLAVLIVFGVLTLLTVSCCLLIAAQIAEWFYDHVH